MMLELRNVETFLRQHHGPQGDQPVDQRGEIITLIGANGAGKSTTLMTICGIVPPRRGEILFLGKPIHRVEPHEIVALGSHRSPKGAGSFRSSR